MLRCLYLMSIYYLFGFLSHQDTWAYTDHSLSRGQKPSKISWNKRKFLGTRKEISPRRTGLFVHQHGRRDLQLKLFLVFTSD